MREAMQEHKIHEDRDHRYQDPKISDRNLRERLATPMNRGSRSAGAARFNPSAPGALRPSSVASSAQKTRYQDPKISDRNLQDTERESTWAVGIHDLSYVANDRGHGIKY